MRITVYSEGQSIILDMDAPNFVGECNGCGGTSFLWKVESKALLKILEALDAQG